MVAYDGDTPVFATLFSSGRNKKDTPPALYRIRSKSSITKMAAEERETNHYEVSEVPWATRFRSGLYFHAAYWHDQFGTPKSHGCVNLAPTDAKWVYDWTDPTMPAGWNELEVAAAGSVVVLIHDALQPDPPVFDYDKEAIERVKIRKQEKALKKKREEAEAAAAAAGTTSPPP
ncbi:MAG: L,D-transpeptidase [Myxococcales bacterium]|nr:L,D-transpeptidase [Myxococcales bacterium]